MKYEVGADQSNVQGNVCMWTADDKYWNVVLTQ